MNALKVFVGMVILTGGILTARSFADTATTTTAPAKPKCCMKACGKMGDCCTADSKTQKTDCPMDGSCCGK